MEFITQYWPQILTVAGLGAWLVRLESNVKRLEKDRIEDLRSAKESRQETNAKLDRMDDKMERGFQELRSDIKTLIQQGAN